MKDTEVDLCMIQLEDTMNEENKEVCPKCGNSDFAIARDMHSTRFCKCGETWIPKPKENKTVFDLNDRVTAFGVEGIVVSVECGEYYPIRVKFDSGNFVTFDKYGKLESWNLEPSLKLIEKAKKKVKKKFWIYINTEDIKAERILGNRALHKEKPSYKFDDYQMIELEVEE